MKNFNIFYIKLFLIIFFKFIYSGQNFKKNFPIYNPSRTNFKNGDSPLDQSISEGEGIKGPVLGENKENNKILPTSTSQIESYKEIDLDLNNFYTFNKIGNNIIGKNSNNSNNSNKVKKETNPFKYSICSNPNLDENNSDEGFAGVSLSNNSITPLSAKLKSPYFYKKSVDSKSKIKDNFFSDDNYINDINVNNNNKPYTLKDLQKKPKLKALKHFFYNKNDLKI